MATLPCLEIGASREHADLSIIFMHGLGADAEDLADVAFYLSKTASTKWRFILPTAPAQPVTINGGMAMPAWYDIIDLSLPRAVNWSTVEQSQTAIEELIHAEIAPRILVAGFSQGAAMALHTGLRNQERICGIAALSGYLLESTEHPCPPKTADIPIALFHGTEDSAVPFDAAQSAKDTLCSKGFTPALKPYQGMEHTIEETEIHDLKQWIEST